MGFRSGTRWCPESMSSKGLRVFTSTPKGLHVPPGDFGVGRVFQFMLFFLFLRSSRLQVSRINLSPTTQINRYDYRAVRKWYVVHVEDHKWIKRNCLCNYFPIFLVRKVMTSLFDLTLNMNFWINERRRLSFVFIIYAWILYWVVGAKVGSCTATPNLFLSANKKQNVYPTGCLWSSADLRRQTPKRYIVLYSTVGMCII